MKIFIGWDPREAVASEVCLESIDTFAPAADARFLKLTDPDVVECFHRPYYKDHNQYVDSQTGTPFSTEFSFSRFLVPHLMGYQGWAMFCDGDFLFRHDVNELFALRDDRYAVMCVHHNHEVTRDPRALGTWGPPKKMDGVLQLAYARKNWSSLMLFNCGHPANERLTPLIVSTMPGRALHSFFWLQTEEIGPLPEEWNWLVGISPTTEAGKALIKPAAYPRNGNGQQGAGHKDFVGIGRRQRNFVRAVHFTEGGPWFDKYQNVGFADEWFTTGGWPNRRYFNNYMRARGSTTHARDRRADYRARLAKHGPWW